MAARLIRLLEAAVAEPERAIGSLDILGADERRTILHDWNDTARAVPSATLPELFAAQVDDDARRHRGGVRGAQPHYGELDARANQLAHHLRELGVGPEVVVGLCVERSLEMLIGLLGILKAGGAYLPLDPGLSARAAGLHARRMPARRCWSPSRRCSTGCRRTAHASCGSMPTGLPSRSSPPPHRPSRSHPQHPAYVIYTSGSTGTPKGVAVTHAGIPNLAAVQIDWLTISPEARILQFPPLSFDAAVWEISAGLASGAALILTTGGA